VWFLALAATCSLVARADEAPSIYVFELWTEPTGGKGFVARTIGPMMQAQCTGLLPREVEALSHTLPAGMFDVIRSCLTQTQLSHDLVGFNCTATSNQPVREHPEAKLSVYACSATTLHASPDAPLDFEAFRARLAEQRPPLPCDSLVAVSTEDANAAFVLTCDVTETLDTHLPGRIAYATDSTGIPIGGRQVVNGSAQLIKAGVPADATGLYAVGVWAAPGSVGTALTLGPMTGEQCNRKMQDWKTLPAGLPPNLMHLAQACVPLNWIPSSLAGFNCTATSSDVLPKHPQMTLWTYSCYVTP
jgi:hypothetical protein